ncbi:MATE family efflux transporter [Streptosporangium sp. NPDC051023]|uniref:MATE family efflux transporter n=1 Tax=Streptosporangium sp. NPDC051023 TaxID=3155410 RepID=UPI00344E9A91
MAVGDVTSVVLPIAMVAMLGRAVGDHALLVRSLYLPMELIYVAIQLAFSVSGQVSAAIGFGARRKDEVAAQTAGLAVLWAALGAAMALALWFMAPHLATVLGVGLGEHDDFVALVRWSAICHPLLAVPVLSSAALRGAGRPKASTALTAIGSVLELGTVAFLGVGGGLGANAIPVAFAVGGVGSGTLGVFLMRRAGLWPTGGFELGPQVRRALGRLTSVGVPVCLSYVVLSISNFVLLSLLGPLGPTVQAGYANALTLQTFITAPGVVLGSATAILMNQQRGAGRESESGRTFQAGLKICAVVYIPLAAAAWLGRDWLGWLSTTDPAIHAETARFLAIVGPTYVILGLTLLALTAIEQIGMGVLATVLNLVYFIGITAIGGWAARAGNSSLGLYWTVAAFNLSALAGVVSITLLVRRRSGEVTAS